MALDLCKSLAFEAFPDTTVALALFQGVGNAESIKKQLVAKTVPIDAALLDADLVPHTFVTHLATFKALAAREAGSLRTHTLHADIVVNHSGSKHISAALNTFGVNAQTTRVLAARVDATAEDLKQIGRLVGGMQVPVPDGMIGDEAKIRKGTKASPQELSVGSLLDAAICKVAALDC